MPGTPTSQQGEGNRPADSTTPEHPTHGTAHAPGTQPVPPQPQIPSPRVPPRTTDALPGVPGSPIKYDTTELLGTDAAGTKATIEERIRGNRGCDRDLCGVTVVVTPRPGGKCVSEISPGGPPGGGPASVQPGGTVRVYQGTPCFGETIGETTSSEGATPVHPTPEVTPESTPEPTTGTTGSGPWPR
ncbi:hypothetical protein ACIQMJ_21925 [Actinosynnema sp. NPDC091369]